MKNKKRTLNNLISPQYNDYEVDKKYLSNFLKKRQKIKNKFLISLKKNYSRSSYKIFSNIKKEINKKYFENLFKINKNFEITKKIYDFYNPKTLKPISKNEFSNVNNYLKFAELLLLAFKKSKSLIFLNSYFKIIDILILSKINNTKKENIKEIIKLINEEKKIIKRITNF